MTENKDNTSKINNNSGHSTKKIFSMSEHAMMGAMIAAFVATLWVTRYLGTNLAGLYLTDIVLGRVQGINANGAEALFVVVTRYIIGFGLSWGPITAIIAAFQRNKD